MSFSELFIRRPVATTLLTVAIALAGGMGYFKLPVSPLPQVDFPTISVNAQMAGASPDVMAASVATPLERHLGQIADVTEMTSMSSTGATRITMQFGLDRDIDGAARDVEAAINAARADLPASLRSNPTYRKVNPADAPVLILALTSKTLTQGQLYDAADTVIAAEAVASEGHRPGHRRRLVAAGGPGRAQSQRAVQIRHRPGGRARRAVRRECQQSPKGSIEIGDKRFQVYTNDQATAGQAVSQHGRRLSQLARRCSSDRSGRGRRFGRGTFAMPASTKASRRCW